WTCALVSLSPQHDRARSRSQRGKPNPLAGTPPNDSAARHDIAAASGEDLSIDISPSRQVLEPHGAVAHQQHRELSGDARPPFWSHHDNATGSTVTSQLEPPHLHQPATTTEA